MISKVMYNQALTFIFKRTCLGEGSVGVNMFYDWITIKSYISSRNEKS